MIVDPVRTVDVDGTPIEAGVISPLADAKPSILRSLLLPLAIAFGVVFGLVLAALDHHRPRQGRRLGRADRAREPREVRAGDAHPAQRPSRLSEHAGRGDLGQGLVPPLDDDLLGRAVGPAAHEDAAGDRLVEEPPEGQAVGGQLVAVPGDARRLVGARPATGRSCSRR